MSGAVHGVWRAIAPAKLNLTLEVQGRRGDGYHDLESIVISLDLADELRLTLDPQVSERRIRYRDDAGRPVSILTSDDIVGRTWDVLSGRGLIPGTGTVEVGKRIPVAAGLGGGSADAAAFLRAANAAAELGLSEQELSSIGAEIGSDVPACIVGGTLRMSGRGERVAPIDLSAEALGGWSVLLYRPEIPVPDAKTAAMYSALRSSNYRKGAATAHLAAKLSAGEAPLPVDCVNSFDAVADEVMQGLRAARRRMGAAMARAALAVATEPQVPLLAGAGPTLFAVLEPAIADSAAAALRSDGRGFVQAARPLTRKAATAVERAE